VQPSADPEEPGAWVVRGIIDAITLDGTWRTYRFLLIIGGDGGITAWWFS
jgi:hypothetical protein